MKFKAEDGSEWETENPSGIDAVFIRRIPERNELEKWVQKYPYIAQSTAKEAFMKAIEVLADRTRPYASYLEAREDLRKFAGMK
jgi:phosphopantetheinyl transferase (holo-ACP synthase)